MKQQIMLISLSLILTGLSFQLSYAQKLERKVTENLLSKVETSEMVNSSFTFSKNMRRIAFRIKNGNKQMAVVDGKSGTGYDFVSFPVFSPDNIQFAYSARNGSEWFIVVDGRETPVQASEIQGLQFSPDSKTLTYVLKNENKFCLIANNNRGKLYDNIDENSITFSHDSRKIAYTAGLGKKQLNILDGIEGEQFDQVGFPIINSDGSHLSYWAVISNRTYVISDKLKSRSYDTVNSIVLSDNGNHCAYSANREGKCVVVLDNVESETHDLSHTLTFSADGSRFAYAMEKSIGHKEGFKQFIVVDGKRIGPYETVVEGAIKFSSDNKDFVFKAEIHDEFFIVKNDHEGKRYSDVIQYTTSFSPDNTRMAYVAENNLRRMVNADNTEGIPFNDVYSISFSPDSKRFAYSARQDNKELVVVDGSRGEKYDAILGQGEIVFDSPNSFHYISMKGNNIFLVEETFE